MPDVEGLSCYFVRRKANRMAAVAKRASDPMSVEAFLAWEGEPGVKHELVEGLPRAMAPASQTHGRIQATAARVIGNHLAASRRECSIVTEPGIVPRVQSATNLRVPDLAVSCAPDDPRRKPLPDPILIIEIFSASNLRETRDNIWAFTTIPSVLEILAVHSAKIAAELLRRRSDGSWPELPEEIGPGGILRLGSIGLELPLDALYAQTHLAPQGR
jgi:Uma2 family endonuclease